MGNNPINFVDPTGHVAWSVTFGGSVAVFFGVRFDVGIAWDDDGNFGFVGDLGTVKGLSVGAGFEGSAYDLDGVADLRGYSNARGFSYVVVGGEWVFDTEGKPIGGGVSVGSDGWAYAVYSADIHTAVLKVPFGDWWHELFGEEEPLPQSLRDYYRKTLNSNPDPDFDDDTLKMILQGYKIPVPEYLDPDR